MIVLGILAVALVVFGIVGLMLCVAARIGDDLAEHAHRDEHIASASLYSTSRRDVLAVPADPRVVIYMHGGLSADDAVARTLEGQR